MVKDYYVLANDYRMPKLGLGTYKLMGQQAYDTVLQALKLGYRHIDSAIIYKNEEEVGRAIRDSQIPREEIFITSKLPPHIKNKKSAKRMFERTLKNLGVDYIDAYIINAPGPFHDLDGDYDQGNVEVYKFLEELYQEELVGAIGVSQFKVKDLKNILDHCDLVPHINQISFFIGHTQDELVKFCKEQGIQIQAFSPLAKGYLKENPIISEMAKRYQVSVPRLALRYNIEKQVAPIPKASSYEHLQENMDLDFLISKNDIQTLDTIDEDPRVYDD